MRLLALSAASLAVFLYCWFFAVPVVGRAPFSYFIPIIISVLVAWGVALGFKVQPVWAAVLVFAFPFTVEAVRSTLNMNRWAKDEAVSKITLPSLGVSNWSDEVWRSPKGGVIGLRTSYQVQLPAGEKLAALQAPELVLTYPREESVFSLQLVEEKIDPAPADGYFLPGTAYRITQTWVPHFMILQDKIGTVVAVLPLAEEDRRLVEGDTTPQAFEAQLVQPPFKTMTTGAYSFATFLKTALSETK